MSGEGLKFQRCTDYTWYKSYEGARYPARSGDYNYTAEEYGNITKVNLHVCGDTSELLKSSELSVQAEASFEEARIAFLATHKLCGQGATTREGCVVEVSKPYIKEKWSFFSRLKGFVRGLLSTGRSGSATPYVPPTDTAHRTHSLPNGPMLYQ